MDPLFDTYLKDLIKIRRLKNVEKSNKKVISTCIFMPEKPSVSYKTTVYITGLIKFIETFSRTMGNNWILRVYCDNMYFTGVKPKVIDSVARSDSETVVGSNIDHSVGVGLNFEDNLITDIASRLRSNESVFESIRNVSINDKSTNNKYVKKVKTQIDENKQFLKKIEKLMNFYLRKVISSGEKRYKNIEIYSFDCPKASRGEPNFLGHYNTFGSIIRFLPMFDPNVSTMFCTNSRYKISPILKMLIDDWDKNPKKKMFTFSYPPAFIINNIKNNIDIDIKNIKDDEIVFKKAESGNPKESVIKEIKESREIHNLFIECVNDMFSLKHNMFGDTNPSTFDDIGKFVKKTYINKEHLKRLDGLINSGYSAYNDDENTISIAAGIFGMKSDCPLIEFRKKMFAKMLRYYILKSKDSNNFASFDFGIDETILKVFIAFEVGTMNFYDNSISYKDFGDENLKSVTEEEIREALGAYSYMMEEHNIRNGEDLLSKKELLEFEDAIDELKRMKIDYISNHNSRSPHSHYTRFGLNTCTNILNLTNENTTFLTDTENNPVILSGTLNFGSFDRELFIEDGEYFDIRMYDAKSLLKIVDDVGTKSNLPPNKQLVFNFCIGKKGDDLHIDIGNLFSFFDEDKPLYLYDSSKHNKLSNVVKLLGIDNLKYFTFLNLYTYNNEKHLQNLINEIIEYYGNERNFIPYKINIIEDDEISFIRDQLRGIKFAKITRDLNTRKLGFGIRQNQYGEFIIKNVEEYGPADFADVLVNDKLVSIQGINIEGKTYDQVAEIFKNYEQPRYFNYELNLGLIKEKFYKKSKRKRNNVSSKIDMSQIFRPFKYKYMYSNLNNNAFTNMTSKEQSRKKFSIKKKFMDKKHKRRMSKLKRYPKTMRKRLLSV